MSPFRRVVIGGLAIGSTLLLLAVGAILSAPFWIDADAVKNEIAALVLQTTGDVVELDRLKLHLFPSLSVEISRPRYAVANVAELSAATARVEVRFWPLITGRVQPGDVSFAGVRATVHLPAAAAEQKPFSVAAADRQLREILAVFLRAAPALRASVEDAVVTVLPPGRPPFVLRIAAARIKTSDGRIEGELACASDVWETMSLAFSIAGNDLDGSGRLEFVGLKLDQLAALLGDAPLSVEAESIGRIDWRMRGLSDLGAEAIAFAPRLLLRQGDGRLEAIGVTAAAGFELKNAAVKLDLHRLYAQSPHVLLSGRLNRDARGRHELELHASGADLADLQSTARQLAPDIPWMAAPPVSLRAGTLTAMELHNSADDPARLFDVSTLKAEAALEGVAIDIARPAISLSGIRGRLELEQGELRVQGATAILGKSTLHDGQLAMRLAGDNDLRADALIDLDLGESLALARKVIKRRDIDAQLDAVEKLDGSAVARVSLSGNRSALQAAVELSQLALFVRHRDVPLPVRLTGGRFTYADNAIALSEISGEFGRSGFTGLDASLALAPPHRFEMTQRGASLSLEELYAAARGMPALAPFLSEIRNLSGNASLAGVRVQGTLKDPAAAGFRANVSPHNVKLLTQRLDSEILIDGGHIEVSDRAIDARGVGVSALDSALRLSARAEDYRAGLSAIDATLEGEIGAMTLERIYQAAGIGTALQVRAPLRFEDSSIGWKKSGDLSFKGRITAAGTIDLDIDARKSGDKLVLERLALRGQGSDAVLSGEYSGEEASAAFKGNLTGGAIAGLLVQPPFSMEGIEGDLRIGIHLHKPWIKHVEGRLQGRAIVLPSGRDLPLKVEHINLTAGEAKVRIEDAVLSAGENRVEIHGDVRRENDKLVIDADVRADRIVLPEAMTKSDAPRDGDQEPFRLSDLPVAGRIGVDIRSLKTDRATLAPLVAEVTVARENLDLHITEAALCGITVSGTLRGPIENLRLAGSLAARNADLKKSIACLTGGRIVGSGSMNLDAKFSAEAPLAQLGERLDGRFSATAREGNIEQFDTLNKIFSFLNITELVRGEKLGATGSGLPFRTVRLKGTLAGTAIHIEEADLDAPAVHIAAAGHIDYGNYKLSMDVLVAPLQTANVVLDNLPLIKRIFGGTVLALPVQVLGTVKKPIIVPLGPGAVASRLTGIISNTMRLPLDAFQVFSPKPPDAANAQEQDRKATDKNQKQ